MLERTPRRWWWLAALGAAAALGVAFVVADSQVMPPHVQLERASPPAGAPSAAAVGAHDVAGGAATPTRIAADEIDPTVGVVMIVDELDRPVPGADVAWQRVTSTDWHSEPLHEREQEVRAAGVQVLADARGRVVVPDARHARVVARHGDRYGQGIVHFAAHERQQRVRIARDVTVRLVAVDAAGAPQAGVPIELAYRDAPDDRYLPWGPWRLAGITGSDGRLAVAAVQTLPHWPRARPTIALRAFVFGAEGDYVEVDLAAAPPEIRVPCPASGRAALQVFKPDGFAVRTVPDPIPLSRASGSSRTFERYFTTRTAPNAVVLGPLALGVHWDLREPFANGFAGPKQHGETVIVRAELREPQRSLLVLAPDGRPLRDARVHSGPNVHRLRHSRTDADGWLAMHGSFGDGWVFSDELLAAATAAGIGDGGTIALSPLLRTTLLCVDAASGEPVAADAHQQRGANPDVALFFVHGRSRRHVDVLSDRGGILHVLAAAEGYKWTTVDVTAGSTDVVVPMQSDGTFTLAVRLLVDDELPAYGIEARIMRGTALTDTTRTRRVGSGAIEASWGGLPDEPHRVEIRLTDGVGLVRVVENLRPSRDGAIAAVIDLRGLAAVATFDGARGSFHVTDGIGWDEFGPTERPLLLPKGACWHGFLTGVGLPVLFPIRAGRNATSVAPYPTLRVAYPGAGTTFDPEGISVGVWLLRRQEPLLDAFEAARRTPDDEPPSPPPDFASLTLDQLAELLEVGFRFSLVDPAPALSYVCHVRGVYIVVPRLDDVPLLDQAVEVAIDGTVADVVATVTIDPLRLAAARRAQAEAKEPSEGR